MEGVDVVRANDRFVAHSGLVSRRIGHETILVPVSSRVGDLDAIYTLNEIGAAVWRLLERPVSAGQIVDAVCADYDIAADAAAADVAEFLGTLLERRLVDRAGTGEA